MTEDSHSNFRCVLFQGLTVRVPFLVAVLLLVFCYTKNYILSQVAHYPFPLTNSCMMLDDITFMSMTFFILKSNNVTCVSLSIRILYQITLWKRKYTYYREWAM